MGQSEELALSVRLKHEIGLELWKEYLIISAILSC